MGQRAQCEGLDLKVHTFPVGSAMDAKRAVLDEIGGERCACMGNGRNDVCMFENAALSIGIIDREGAYSGLLKQQIYVLTVRKTDWIFCYIRSG